MGVLGALNSSHNAPTQFQLTRINPRDGQAVWGYDRSESPSALDFQGHRIALAFPDRLEVLTFLAF